MSYYGFTVTNNGRELIAKLTAGKQLVLSRIMVGSGKCPDDVDPKMLTELDTPVAMGTSTIPSYDGNAVRMIVEYRSDMNGGLEQGFWLNEFGIYAFDPDKGEVLMYYGCLGDYPQWVSPMTGTGVDVRRFPVCIFIGDDSGVEVDYSCEAWMTAEDVDEYCTITILPKFLEHAGRMIAEHNANAEAHPYIQGLITALDSRLSLIELMYSTEIKDNSFCVTFNTLDGVTATGVWNKTASRIEY